MPATSVLAGVAADAKSNGWPGIKEELPSTAVPASDGANNSEFAELSCAKLLVSK